MAKKRKQKKYAGKTEKEWRDWGEDFGKGIDSGSKKFSEGMERWGDDFGKHVERHGRRMEKEWKNWWFDAFGFVGPLLVSIIGIFFLAIGIWILNFVNFSLHSIFIFMLSNFLASNIQWFFLATLFLNYAKYFSRKYEGYWIFSPMVNSLNIVYVVWILTSIFILIGVYTGVNILTNFANFLNDNLLGLFILFALIGYIFEFTKKIFCLGCKK